MIYDNFAALYDELFDPDQYTQWIEYAKKRLGSPSDSPRILDLAGGSGRFSVLMAKLGYQVCDLDLSSSMLSLADQHAHENKVKIDLVQSDMRDLSGLGIFDGVVSFADSLCYLPSPEDVQIVLSQVYDHLMQGGRFLFDVWSLYQIDHVFPGYCYNDEPDDGKEAMLWRSYADDDVKHGIIHELTFFNEDDDGRYVRTHETHFERTYPIEEWTQLLKQTGFNNIKISADFGRNEINEKTTRWFFDCQKE